MPNEIKVTTIRWPRSLWKLVRRAVEDGLAISVSNLTVKAVKEYLRQNYKGD